MEVRRVEIPVYDIVAGYRCNDVTGQVIGCDGDLDIRQPFQRERCYEGEDRDAVIKSILAGFPLNVMYWSRDSYGTYELVDGQRRITAFCDYIMGKYSVDSKHFHDLTPNEQRRIMTYNCTVYICEGTREEQLEWFRMINKHGGSLSDQELLNVLYSGPWLTDAEKYFSKPGGPAELVGGKYLSGSAIQQDYLETALTWISNRDGIEVREYMARHQNDDTACELWDYFKAVIDWVDGLFGKHYREDLMQGLPWGLYYNSYGPCVPGRPAFDPDVLEQCISKLERDGSVTNRRGIYEYVLGGECDEKLLYIRSV